MKQQARGIFTRVVLAIAAVFSMTTGVFAAALTITGAGATFPYPVYSRWAQAYQSEKHIKINYQSIGSGAGIKQVKAKTVDFGASDKPLSSDDLKKNELLQFPAIIGAVVPVVNLEGIKSGELKLNGDLLAAIFLGKIKNWNHPAIIELNPSIKLPDQAITIVHRADGSGTTFLMTDYLAKVSDTWKTQVGSDTAVSWPVGLGGKGNEGVSVYVKLTPGSIGYVEYAYAMQSHLNTVQLKNKAGHFVQPTLDNFKETAFNADWFASPDFNLVLTDQPGANSWPILGASYILLNRISAKPQQTKAVADFFDWAFDNGGSAALELNYVPIPVNVMQAVKKAWKTQLKDTQGKAIWSANPG